MSFAWVAQLLKFWRTVECETWPTAMFRTLESTLVWVVGLSTLHCFCQGLRRGHSLLFCRHVVWWRTVGLLVRPPHRLLSHTVTLVGVPRFTLGQIGISLRGVPSSHPTLPGAAVFVSDLGSTWVTFSPPSQLDTVVSGCPPVRNSWNYSEISAETRGCYSAAAAAACWRTANRCKLIVFVIFLFFRLSFFPLFVTDTFIIIIIITNDNVIDTLIISTLSQLQCQCYWLWILSCFVLLVLNCLILLNNSHY